MINLKLSSGYISPTPSDKTHLVKPNPAYDECSPADYAEALSSVLQAGIGFQRFRLPGRSGKPLAKAGRTMASSRDGVADVCLGVTSRYAAWWVLSIE